MQNERNHVRGCNEGSSGYSALIEGTVVQATDKLDLQKSMQALIDRAQRCIDAKGT